jgi:hypothetical protein
MNAFDPQAWDGDATLLEPYVEQLCDDTDLCERTFASKHEAFTAGLYLGKAGAVAAEAQESTG